MPLNHTLRNGYYGKFDVLFLSFAILKIQNKENPLDLSLSEPAWISRHEKPSQAVDALGAGEGC